MYKYTHIENDKKEGSFVDLENQMKMFVASLRVEKLNPNLYKQISRIHDYLQFEKVIWESNSISRNDLDDHFYITKKKDKNKKEKTILVLSDQNCVFVIEYQNLSDLEEKILQKIFPLHRLSLKSHYNEGIDEQGYLLVNWSEVCDSTLVDFNITKELTWLPLNESISVYEVLRNLKETYNKNIFWFKNDWHSTRNLKRVINVIL